MADTDPTKENIEKHLDFKRRAKELLAKHEHCLPYRTLTVGEDYTTDYMCPECRRTRPHHREGCRWKEMMDE